MYIEICKWSYKKRKTQKSFIIRDGSSNKLLFKKKKNCTLIIMVCFATQMQPYYSQIANINQIQK